MSADAAAIREALLGEPFDLRAAIENGVPERERVPGTGGLLLPGVAHVVYAERGKGKSLALTVAAAHAARAGVRVLYLDRENGARTMTERLADIVAARPDLADGLYERFVYRPFPMLRGDWQPATYAEALSDFGIVIYDSIRTFLSPFDLDPDKEKGVTWFLDNYVVPLQRTGTAVVLADNTGHAAPNRPKGSGTKLDGVEVGFHVKTTERFTPDQTGTVELKCTRSRFGDEGRAWALRVGGGTYDQPVEKERPEAEPGRVWRPTGQMERVSRALEADPGLSKKAVRTAVKGANDTIDLALEMLIAEQHVRIEEDGQAHRHHVVRPYREGADEPDRADRAGPCRNGAGGTVVEDRAAVPHPKGGTGTGTGSAAQPSVPDALEAEPATPDEEARAEQLLADHGGAA